MKIALIHNLKPAAKASHLPPDYYSECDSPKTVAAIAKALRSSGHAVFPVEADHRLPEWLKENPVDLGFNLSEGFQGEAREARVPALLELMGIPYTGSGVLALSLALDKAKSKQLFCYGGIPTPKFQVFHQSDDPLEKRLHFPLIVKPNREGSAKGIWASSVVHDEPALQEQVRRVYNLYAQEVLVEEFIEGTELTVGILGSDQILPVLEIDFSDCGSSGESFYSWRMKEFQGNKEMGLTPRFHCPARLSPSVTTAVQVVALKAAKAVGFRDVARVDIRLSSDGIPYVLEVNPLPGLDPEESNLPLIAQAAGISHEALIQRMVDLAMERSRKKPYQSSIPYSQLTNPPPKAPDSRALPDSGSHGADSPDDPAVAVPQPLSPQGKAREKESKEEPLGR